MTIEQIAQGAEREGRIWLCGEMEIPYPCTIAEAFARMNQIAEDCGYLVSWQGRTMLHVSGGDICGYYSLDWYAPGNLGPQRIDYWTCKTVHLDPKGEAA